MDPITLALAKKYTDKKIKDSSGGSAGGGVTSWNDLTDKPFYEEKIYVKDIYSSYDEGEDNYYTLTSDKHVSIPFVPGKKYYISARSQSSGACCEGFATAWEDRWSAVGIDLDYFDGESYYSFGYYAGDVSFSYGDPYGLTVCEVIDNYNPEDEDDYVYTKSIYVTIDDNFIPSNIPRKKDIPVHNWETLLSKPFYEEEIRTYIIEENEGSETYFYSDHNSQYATEDGYCYVYTFENGIEFDFDLEVGKKYIVQFMSKEYECIAKYINDEDNVVYIGNPQCVTGFKDVSTSNGDSFAIYVDKRGETPICRVVYRRNTGGNGGGSVYLYAYSSEIVVHKIDSKFLPTISFSMFEAPNIDVLPLTENVGHEDSFTVPYIKEDDCVLEVVINGVGGYISGDKEWDTGSEKLYGNPSIVSYMYDKFYDVDFAFGIKENGDSTITITLYLEDTENSKSIHVYKDRRPILPREYLPKMSGIADITEAPTADDFNALLTVLRAAGYMEI